jgi:hypothetical protein
MMEASLIIGLIQRSFVLQLDPGYRVAADPLLTLRFKQGLSMRPILV